MHSKEVDDMYALNTGQYIFCFFKVNSQIEAPDTPLIASEVNLKQKFLCILTHTGVNDF